MLIKESNSTNSKLYSQRAIVLATFIGGPLAAGYLIRQNYLSLNKPKQAIQALLSGVIATIVLFAAIFMIPEAILDKIPSIVIPAIYTVIVYVIVEQLQGKILSEYQQAGNEFYSRWKAAGVGFVSLIILLIGIFSYVYLSMNKDYSEYDAKIAEFLKNETKTLVIYDHLETETYSSLLQELQTLTIPTWEENIKIIQQSTEVEDLPAELIEQNKVLLTYAQLRLKAFKLLEKTLEEDTDAYSQELKQTHEQIDEQMQKLKLKLKS